MNYDEIRHAWNAQADEHNQWDDLGEDEKIEWAASIAAAKERAARQAAQTELIELKERIARAGVEQEGWTPVSERLPPFTSVAQRKLDDLLARGFRITGYSIERADVADWSPQRGFITHGGMVGWWLPHATDARKDAES